MVVFTLVKSGQPLCRSQKSKVKMVPIPAEPNTETLLIEFPQTVQLFLTQEQFNALAAVNRDLGLEKTLKGE